jgi:hypothetical protein
MKSVDSYVRTFMFETVHSFVNRNIRKYDLPYNSIFTIDVFKDNVIIDFSHPNFSSRFSFPISDISHNTKHVLNSIRDFVSDYYSKVIAYDDVKTVLNELFISP